MARIIKTICDNHEAHHDEEVEAKTYRLGLAAEGGRWVWTEVDLCAEDAKPLEGLHALLADWGRVFNPTEDMGAKGPRAPRSMSVVREPVVAAGATDGEFVCPACGKAYTGKSGLTSHLRRIHEMSWTEAMGGPAGEHPCPECERMFTTPQGLASHRRITHGHVAEAVG